MASSEQRAPLLDLSLQVIIHADWIEAEVGHAALGKRLGLEGARSEEPIDLSIPTLMVRRGAAVKLTIEFGVPSDTSRRDPKLVELIAKAHEAKRMLA